MIVLEVIWVDIEKNGHLTKTSGRILAYCNYCVFYFCTVNESVLKNKVKVTQY